MSAQQKLKDMVALVQKDRKAQVVAGCVVLGIIFLMVHEPKQRRAASPAFVVRDQPADAIGAASATEVYNDLQEVVVKRLDEHKSMIKGLGDEVQKTNSRIEENEIRTAEIFETLIKRVEAQRAPLPEYAPAPGEGPPEGDSPLFGEEAELFTGDQLESFGEVALDSGTVAPPPIQEIDNRKAYIAPTDFVRVKLLAGVNAPTDGAPYPVLLEVIGDVQSPDGGSLPLGNARILAAAQGSLVDSRALFRLTTLTMRLPNGEVLDTSIDGWVVGEDGIRGLKGVTIDPLGQVLAATAVTGLVAGAGNALQGAQVTTFQDGGGFTQTFTGDLGKAALGGALAQPANTWSDMIKERVEEQSPLIQVYSGREMTAVFSRGTPIPRLFQMLESDEEDVYSGLD